MHLYLLASKVFIFFTVCSNEHTKTIDRMYFLSIFLIEIELH